ncbi:unnamed protein product [Closterium sp. NIES-64]|nr:unnamed protein product [Closterium sp. NIES-64]
MASPIGKTENGRGDVLSGSDGADGEHYSGLLEEWAGGSTWWNSRLTVLLASIVAVIGPLVALPDIDSLWFTSGLSVLLAVAFVIITILITLYKLVEGTIDWSGVHWFPQLNTSQDYWHLLSVIPTMATAFTCHYNRTILAASLYVPGIQSAFELAGSTGAATIAFCLPGMVALSERTGGLTAPATQRAAAWFLLLLGLGVCFSGLADSGHTFLQ